MNLEYLKNTRYLKNMEIIRTPTMIQVGSLVTRMKIIKPNLVLNSGLKKKIKKKKGKHYSNIYSIHPD